MAKDIGVVAVTTKKNFTQIASHNCANEGQDKLYGKGQRLMNSCKGGDSLRCTVCGLEKKK